jgi:hypothetical protein
MIIVTDGKNVATLTEAEFISLWGALRGERAVCETDLDKVEYNKLGRIIEKVRLIRDNCKD